MQAGGGACLAGTWQRVEVWSRGGTLKRPDTARGARRRARFLRSSLKPHFRFVSSITIYNINNIPQSNFACANDKNL